MPSSGRDWEQFHLPKNLAMALSVEVAEIVEHFQRLTEEQSQDLPPEKLAQIREEIEEPKIEGPPDVIVRIGAAGLCRTDIHIIEGQWKPIQDPDRTLLPYTLGHENAGWVEEVGAGVTNVEGGDTVILHPPMTCGQRRACRAGDDMHCENGEFPGLSRDG